VDLTKRVRPLREREENWAGGKSELKEYSSSSSLARFFARHDSHAIKYLLTKTALPNTLSHEKHEKKSITYFAPHSSTSIVVQSFVGARILFEQINIIHKIWSTSNYL
jgi:hypothetical protein